MKKLYIFDWDDTLFPTSWFKQLFPAEYNQRDFIDISFNDDQQNIIDHCDTIISDTLKYIISTDDVIYIVTYAAMNWFSSCISCLPKTASFIDAFNNLSVFIISVPDLYADNIKVEIDKFNEAKKNLTYPDSIDPEYELIGYNYHKNNFKSKYFVDHISKIINDNHFKIIVNIGDGHCEHEAFKNMISSCFNNNFLLVFKSIKFKQFPDVSFLNYEISYLIDIISHIEISDFDFYYFDKKEQLNDGNLYKYY